MQSFLDCFASAPYLVGDGSIYERITRGGLVRHDPHIASASAIYDPAGRKAMAEFYTQYWDLAAQFGLPMVSTASTRKATFESIAASPFAGRPVLEDNMDFLRQLAKGRSQPLYIGALLGCKGDAYNPREALSFEEAAEFHRHQAQAFAKTGADVLVAGIMPEVNEARGMAAALSETGIPYWINLMCDHTGHLLDGTTIHDAITRIDATVPDRPPLFYQCSCIHPDNLREGLEQPFNQAETVRARLRGTYANTSRLSPSQIAAGASLHPSSPTELLSALQRLHQAFPLKFYGGCCGTDDRHMRLIMEWVSRLTRQAGQERPGSGDFLSGYFCQKVGK